MNKKLRSVFAIFMVMLTIALSVPAVAITSFAASLKAPVNLKATQTTSSLTLTWDAAENATGYRVYYKNGKNWKKCATLTGTTVTFKNLPAGTKYTLAVKSYNKCQCHPDKVTWSDNYTTIETATVPKVPAKLAIKATESTITISWSESKGASGYMVYYKHPPFGWKEIKDTNKTSITITKLVPGNLYTFAVRPYINTASGTIWGDYKEFTGHLAPKAPSVEVSSPEAKTVKVKWSNVLCADGYQLYYKYNNGSWKLYKTYDKAQDLTFKNLKGGTYTFAVRAYINTSAGRVYSSYKPVSVKVDGKLPCGCNPGCCYCN